ncbi:MAG: transcriptional repressor LexA [Clostridiales bacterium]|nr:transcriptional repressor LexA [Clostridiales bacterium]
MRSKNEEYFRLIEDYINDYKDKNGSTPTVREIESGIGLSKATVSRYLSYMRDNGMIDYAGHRNITTKESKKTRSETVKVPVLGVVSCGVPKYAEENIEEYVRLPVALFGRGDFFILRASGDSMIDADIYDGDLVLIRQQTYADEGQIVVALMEDEATLKRYYPEPANHRVRLHPENESLDDIYVDDCIIQGVAVKVIKDLA